MVCKDCGAAVSGDNESSLRKIGKPYHRKYADYPCQHPAGRVVNTYLGNQFRTDMVVYEIALDTRQVNVSSSGLWIRRAGQTLAEAMTLAGGRLQDIEFSELKSGYRLRYSEDGLKTFIDAFLFDSACHECLMHYWNQRVHGLLDRFAAIELLKWCENSEMPQELTYNLQEELLEPLNVMGAEYKIVGDGIQHYVETQDKKCRIVVYPAMWNENSSLLPDGVIAIADKLIKYALPKVDEMIRTKIKFRA